MIRSMPDWSRCSLRPYPALSLFLRFASAPSLVASSLRAACATPFNCRLKWPKICQFQRLGLQAQAAGMWRYSLPQRYHKRQLQSKAPKVLNPLVFSCEANESVVWHVSRISRRVCSRTASGRVLDRICIKTQNSLDKKFKDKPRRRHTSRWWRRLKATEGAIKRQRWIEKNPQGQQAPSPISQVVVLGNTLAFCTEVGISVPNKCY